MTAVIWRLWLRMMFHVLQWINSAEALMSRIARFWTNSTGHCWAPGIDRSFRMINGRSWAAPWRGRIASDYGQFLSKTKGTSASIHFTLETHIRCSNLDWLVSGARWKGRWGRKMLAIATDVTFLSRSLTHRLKCSDFPNKNSLLLENQYPVCTASTNFALLLVSDAHEFFS